jgi:hypothetical protein
MRLRHGTTVSYTILYVFFFRILVADLAVAVFTDRRAVSLYHVGCISASLKVTQSSRRYQTVGSDLDTSGQYQGPVKHSAPHPAAVINMTVVKR